MSDDKYDLEKGLKAMRYVAKMLNTWANDLEACLRWFSCPDCGYRRHFTLRDDQSGVYLSTYYVWDE